MPVVLLQRGRSEVELLRFADIRANGGFEITASDQDGSGQKRPFER